MPTSFFSGENKFCIELKTIPFNFYVYSDSQWLQSLFYFTNIIIRITVCTRSRIPTKLRSIDPFHLFSPFFFSSFKLSTLLRIELSPIEQKKRPKYGNLSFTLSHLHSTHNSVKFLHNTNSFHSLISSSAKSFFFILFGIIQTVYYTRIHVIVYKIYSLRSRNDINRAVRISI